MPSPKAQALAAHLDAAAPSVTSPWHYLAVVYAWLASTLSEQIDTPAEREAIEAVVMAQYDAIVVSLSKTQIVLAGIFAAMRQQVKNGLDFILVALAPAPPPTPAPAAITIPAGSAQLPQGV